MSDGSESSLLGDKGHKPNKSFSLPANIKITKLRSGFYDNPAYPGLKYFYKLELFDQNGVLIWNCGREEYYTIKYFEMTVPEDETVVGFKVVTLI